MNDRANTPITKETRKRLKVAAAEEGITMLELLERLIERYLEGEGDEGQEPRGSAGDKANRLLGD
jgi:hypothetical protein